MKRDRNRPKRLTDLRIARAIQRGVEQIPKSNELSRLLLGMSLCTAVFFLGVFLSGVTTDDGLIMRYVNHTLRTAPVSAGSGNVTETDVMKHVATAIADTAQHINTRSITLNTANVHHGMHVAQQFAAQTAALAEKQGVPVRIIVGNAVHASDSVNPAPASSTSWWAVGGAIVTLAVAVYGMYNYGGTAMRKLQLYKDAVANNNPLTKINELQTSLQSNANQLGILRNEVGTISNTLQQVQQGAAHMSQNWQAKLKSMQTQVSRLSRAIGAKDSRATRDINVLQQTLKAMQKNPPTAVKENLKTMLETLNSLDQKIDTGAVALKDAVVNTISQLSTEVGEVYNDITEYIHSTAATAYENLADAEFELGTQLQQANVAVQDHFQTGINTVAEELADLIADSNNNIVESMATVIDKFKQSPPNPNYVAQNVELAVSGGSHELQVNTIALENALRKAMGMELIPGPQGLDDVLPTPPDSPE